MRLFRFFLLLIQRGSFFQQPVDFELQRSQIIDDVLRSTPVPSKKKVSALKSYLLKTRIGYTLLANLSYLKNSGTMNNMFIVSDSHKVVYIRILKSASTSMLREFLPLVDSKLKGVSLSDEQIDVLGFHYAKKNLEPSHHGYTKFALVRNPFERIVSVYLDLFDPGEKTFTYASYWFGVLRQEMSFKDFVETIDKIPTVLLGPHFSSQAYIVKNAGALKNITIFRIEKDNESLVKFLDQYHIRLSYSNKRPQYDYRTYYDPETLVLVNHLYRVDVSVFGYEEEYEMLRQYLKVY